MVSVITDQVIASEEQTGAVGLAVVSDQSVAIGVTAVPTPVTDIANDHWLMYQLYMSNFLFISGVASNVPVNRVWEIDSKAMRKVDQGEDLIVVAESTTPSAGYDITFGGRVLVKVN